MNGYRITPASGDLLLMEDSSLESIAQNVALILGTRKGSVPGYRDFGTPQDFIDLPFPAAQVAMVNPIREAVEEFEPRVRVRAVTCTVDEFGTMTPTVEVTLNAEDQL